MLASVRADPPPAGQIHADAVMLCQAKLLSNGSSGVQFAAMALAVVEGQADDAVALLKGKGRSSGGIQTSGEKRDGSALTHLRTVSSCRAQ